MFDSVFIAAIVSFFLFLLGVIIDDRKRKQLFIALPSILLSTALLVMFAYLFQWDSSIVDALWMFSIRTFFYVIAIFIGILAVIAFYYKWEKASVISAVFALFVFVIGIIPSWPNGTDEHPESPKPSAQIAAPTSAPAYASTPTPTPMPTLTPTPTPTPTPTSTPAPTQNEPSEIIYELGDAPSTADFGIVWQEPFTEPFEGSYLSEYETKYVKSGKGYGVNFYSGPYATDEYKRDIYLLDRTEVVVLARQNGLSCIIYYKDYSGHYHAGWVNSKWLVDSYD